MFHVSLNSFLKVLVTEHWEGEQSVLWGKGK